MRFDTAYSAISIGLASFRSFRGIQSVVPSIHSTSSFHPLVVFFILRFPLFVLKVPSSFVIADSSAL